MVCGVVAFDLQGAVLDVEAVVKQGSGTFQ